LADDESRRALANVLGALSLVVTDELGRAVTQPGGSLGSVTDAATLSALAQFLDGATLDRVHEVMGVTPSGAVRLVDRLERTGLVAREPGTDGRSRAVRLTAAGRAAAEDVGAARSAYLSDLVSSLTVPEVEALRGLLAKLMTSVVDHKQGGAWTCRLCDLVACRRSEGDCPAYNAGLARYGLSSGDASQSMGSPAMAFDASLSSSLTSQTS
jgi:DNA-binding MarR family transcriptional regulator